MHTVSGVSSGGDMAMIHLIVLSSKILGAGVVAGAPYGCQVLVELGDEHACGAPFWPGSGPMAPRNYAKIEAYLKAREKAGLPSMKYRKHTAIQMPSTLP